MNFISVYVQLMIQITIKSFLEKSKAIIFDIFLLYKNFVHWNISKLIIAIW